METTMFRIIFVLQCRSSGSGAIDFYQESLAAQGLDAGSLWSGVVIYFGPNGFRDLGSCLGVIGVIL